MGGGWAEEGVAVGAGVGEVTTSVQFYPEALTNAKK